MGQMGNLRPSAEAPFILWRPVSAQVGNPPTVKSKHVLGGQLQDPGSNVSLNLAEVTAVSSRGRVKEIHPILDIECLEAQVDGMLFPHCKTPGQGEVDTEIAGALERVNALVSQSTRGRRSKG